MNGIASLRGYQEGGPPVPQERPDSFLDRLKKLLARLLRDPVVNRPEPPELPFEPREPLIPQEQRSGIRDKHVVLTDTLQQLRSEVLEAPSWYPDEIYQASPGVDMQYGILPNYNREEEWGDLTPMYGPVLDRISFPEDTTVANLLNPDDPWMGFKIYPERRSVVHEFGHAADPWVQTNTHRDERPLQKFMDDYRSGAGEYPMRDTILAESTLGPQFRDYDIPINPWMIQTSHANSPFESEGQEFAEAFRNAFEFLQSPASRAMGRGEEVEMPLYPEDYVSQGRGEGILSTTTTVPEYYKTIVRELLKLPVYAEHPLGLREW